MQAAEFHRAIADFTQTEPHPRFGVYRNNVTAALINALKVRYPVVEKTVGAEAFASLALAYIAKHLPQSPVLIGYGADFPEFIAGSPPPCNRHPGESRDPRVSATELNESRVIPARPWVPAFAGMTEMGVGCLADLARLENLWWTAYHAAETMPVAPEALAGFAPDALGQLRFGFHPSAGLLQSRWAVGSLWEGSAVDDQPQCVLVWRPQAIVNIHVIEEDTFAFLQALMSGAALLEAVAATAPGFDLQGQLQFLITSQLIVQINPETAP